MNERLCSPADLVAVARMRPAFFRLVLSMPGSFPPQLLKAGGSIQRVHGMPAPLPDEVEEWIYQHRVTVSAGSASLIATVLGFPLDRCVSGQQRSIPDPAVNLRSCHTGRELLLAITACVLVDVHADIMLSLHTSDSVKSRLQVSRYNGVIDCIRKTYKHEGVQGFFRGSQRSPCVVNSSDNMC